MTTTNFTEEQKSVLISTLTSDSNKHKVLFADVIFDTYEEVFNSEYWKEIRKNFYAPDVKSKERVFTENTELIKAYVINDKTYLHYKSKGELIFSELTIHSMLSNAGLNVVIPIGNGIILFHKINAENNHKNRAIFEKRGQTITNEYL